MPIPPNYGVQPARFGKECRLCEFYEEQRELCTKYLIPTKPNMTCDSWKRNPNLPVGVH